MRIRTTSPLSNAALGPYVAERRDASVAFEYGDVLCTLALVAIDRGRKIATYDATLSNKRAVTLSCRLYESDKTERRTRLAAFEARVDSVEHTRFAVKLARGSRSERVFAEITGDGTALLFEMRLPVVSAAAPVARTWLAGMLATLGLTVVLLFLFAHTRMPATVVRRQAARLAYHRVDDADGGASGFRYTGSWQHIHNAPDGRSRGTSTRSYHLGDEAELTFDGVRFYVYGVKGPSGGFAELRVDGRPLALLRFHAPVKEAGVEVYASPFLPAGKHAIEIRVAAAPEAAKQQGYVNIDGVAYATP